jgi:hypothetical protein
MKNNIWTSLIVTYAHPDTRPWEECGQSRQRKDAISRGREEAAASDHVKTIEEQKRRNRHLWSIHLRQKCLECPTKQSTKTSCSNK